MGACEFSTQARGTTAKEAFGRAVSDARWGSGNGGYTGTIAEKGDFVRMGSAKTLKDAHRMVGNFIDEGDSRIDDKWGPAGCIEVEDTPGLYVFFGWASS